MRTNQELRTEIIYRLVKAYREVRRVEKLLAKPNMNRTYRTKCKAARVQAEVREALQMGLKDATGELLEIYQMLPKVRADVIPLEGQLQDARDFAARCAKQPRRRKFVKGQMILEPMNA